MLIVLSGAMEESSPRVVFQNLVFKIRYSTLIFLSKAALSILVEDNGNCCPNLKDLEGVWLRSTALDHPGATTTVMNDNNYSVLINWMCVDR